VTSDNNNRVPRRGPSWAPPVAAEPRPPSAPLVSPLPVKPERVEAERAPLRVAESGRRSQPPPPDNRPEERSAGAASTGASAPSSPPRLQQSADEVTREVGPVQPDYSAPPPRTRAPAPTAAPRHHGEINRDMLFRPTKRPPASGWRRMVHLVTGGGVNPGESPADVSRRHLVERVNQRIRGDYKIAVLSLKGGVGKTTTTVSLGSTFACLRGDHVVAIDANPDLGTLGGRIPSQTAATVRDLLNDQQRIHRYSDVRAFTSQAPSRLEVLASERDPHRVDAFSEADYRASVAILDNFYNLILTDCGTGLTHSAMRGVLDTADSLVLVSSPALDAAQSADATLNWLDTQGFGHLVDRTVVVISLARPGASTVNLDQLVAHFTARVRAVQVIPFDMHLAAGSEIDLDRVGAGTREAFVELAAVVADDFPEAAGRHHSPARVRGLAPRR